MVISEEYLRAIVYRVLDELNAEKIAQQERTTIYMVCTQQWDQRYVNFLESIRDLAYFKVSAIIPADWVQQEAAVILRRYLFSDQIIIQSSDIIADEVKSITVFPVVPRDLVVKTALCINDTFENKWIADCIEQNRRVIFLRSGLKRFSGQVPEAYLNQILSYYRMVLGYGIEIDEGVTQLTQPGQITAHQDWPNGSEKKVITVANVWQYESAGVIVLGRNDIITDLARDKAKQLKIKILASK